MKRLLITLKEKWPEYLLEILVLIIGIYGAFELENWNEDRKEKKENLNYIQSIRKDIQADTTLIRQVIEMLNLQTIAGQYLVPILESDSPIILDSLDFILKFNHLTGAPIISKQNTTWDYVNSSGVITKINDSKLNEMLQSYYRELNSLRENFNQSAIPPRLEIRKLKYELFEDQEHQKFFPTKKPIVPGKQVYNSILGDDRILPLCRFIGSGSSLYFKSSFQERIKSAESILFYLDEKYP